MAFDTRKLTPKLWPDFEAFFDYKGACSGCWCMNHRYPMGLEIEGEPAKASMKALVLSQRVFGVLAYQDHDLIPVGWAALDRCRTLPGHDCIGLEIQRPASHWAIHCVCSRQDMKNQGIEALLVDAATALAQELGATEIEGYPEPLSDPAHPFQTWNTFGGHQSQFESLGYVAGQSQDAYQVMRKKIP